MNKEFSNPMGILSVCVLLFGYPKVNGSYEVVGMVFRRIHERITSEKLNKEVAKVHRQTKVIYKLIILVNPSWIEEDGEGQKFRSLGYGLQMVKG